MRNRFFICAMIFFSIIGCASPAKQIRTTYVDPCTKYKAMDARRELTALNLQFSGEGFYKSAFEGDLTGICLYLAAGMGVDNSSYGGGSALIAASKKGQRPVIELLLHRGANPNFIIPKDARVAWENMNVAGFSSLMFAARRGDLDIVNILLGAGADRDLVSADGTTALSLAEKNGHQMIVDRLKS